MFSFSPISLMFNPISVIGSASKSTNRVLTIFCEENLHLPFACSAEPSPLKLNRKSLVVEKFTENRWLYKNLQGPPQWSKFSKNVCTFRSQFSLDRELTCVDVRLCKLGAFYYLLNDIVTMSPKVKQPPERKLYTFSPFRVLQGSKRIVLTFLALLFKLTVLWILKRRTVHECLRPFINSNNSIIFPPSQATDDLSVF